MRPRRRQSPCIAGPLVACFAGRTDRERMHAVRGGAMAVNPSARRWVDDVAAKCRPEDVVWCDGSEAERERLGGGARPAPKPLPFPGTGERDAPAPTNNGVAPGEAYARLSTLFAGAMKGRTMYV